ncbi:hypothetical protein LPJ71_007760 [Coemansia sp. S17]|nr:hypothetical protein LPJ71_007760 [Coemansia sp. S17]
MSGIATGVAQKLLVDYFGPIKFFPFAYKLIVDIIDYKSPGIDATDVALPNTLEFAEILKSVAPEATTTEILCCDGRSRMINDNDNDILGSKIDDEILVILVNALNANTKSADLRMHTPGIEKLSTIDHTPMLTSLVLQYKESPNVKANLVQMSSSILQHLDIDIRDANMLICDKNNKAVVYPNLRILQLSGCVRSSTGSKAVTSQTAPFPMLRILTIVAPFPFDDDVLFRDNSATLERLNFSLDYDTVIMLNKSRVFENKHKVLRHVLVQANFARGGRDLSLVPEADMSKFLNNLVSAAKRLTVLTLELAQACITASQHGQGFQNIKSFDLSIDSLSLFDVLSLLRVLPALETIRSEISGLGPELENISADELPDYVASTYCDVGKNLQVWDMDTFTGSRAATFINYILLLALVCPKLRRVEPSSNNAGDYHLRLAIALDSGPYSKYATRLNKLFDVFHE